MPLENVLVQFCGLTRGHSFRRFLSPLSAVPLISLAGFGLYELGFPGVSIIINATNMVWLLLDSFIILACITGTLTTGFIRFQVAKCVEIGLPEIILMLIFSQVHVIHSSVLPFYTLNNHYSRSHELMYFFYMGSIYLMLFMWQSPCSTGFLWSSPLRLYGYMHTFLLPAARTKMPEQRHKCIAVLTALEL